jgi:MFS transporter, PPP family, 3-phenylpropionic acid transporter
LLHSRLSPTTRASLFYLAFYFSMAAYLPFINVYFRTLGLSGWKIGVLSALLPAMSLLIVPALAVVADRRRWRVRLLAATVSGCAVSLTLLMLPRGFLALLPLMAVFSAFYSPIVPLADTSIVGMAARYDLNYGGMRLWGSLGFAVSAALFGGIWQYTGYRAMFAVAAGLSVVVAYLALSLDESGHSQRRQRTPLRAIVQDRLLVAVLVTTFLAASSVGMEFTFVGIYMSNLGGSGLLVGLLFAVAAMFELPSMRYSGAIAGRIGAGETLLLGYGLLVVSYLGYAAAPNPYALLACSVVRGLGFGLFYVSTIRMLNERAPAEWAATVQGISNATAYGLGQLITRPLGGRIYDVFGPRVLYLFCAAMVSSAAIIMALTVRPGRSKRASRAPGVEAHHRIEPDLMETSNADLS